MAVIKSKDAKKSNPTVKPEVKGNQPATSKAVYTATDLAKELKIASPAIARRYLRAAKVEKPKNGWEWPSRDAAKVAVEAVQRAIQAQTSKT